MLSEAQQKRVWEGMLGAEIRANYFADYTNRFHRRQRVATFGSVLFSSGAFVSFVLTNPAPWVTEYLRPGLTLLTAIISTYSLVAQNQKSAIDAADLHARWNKLAHEYELLWEDVYADSAQATLEALEQRGMELSKSGTSFPNDEAAMLRWENHVLAHRGLAITA